LPESRTVIPREKPVPKPKPPTKWEEFAKRKVSFLIQIDLKASNGKVGHG